MKTQVYIRALAVAACGGIAFAVIALSTRPSAPGLRVFDLTDRTFNKLNISTANTMGDREIDDPGNVVIKMPLGYAISGAPSSLVFSDTGRRQGVFFYTKGQRFSDASQAALDYCKEYGCDPKFIVEWHDQGKGQPRYPAAEATSPIGGDLVVLVRISDIAPDPCPFTITVYFSWRKSANAGG